MGECEVCGKKGELQKVLIDGIDLRACINCAKSGKILDSPVIELQPIKTNETKIKQNYKTQTETQKSMESSAYRNFKQDYAELVDDFGNRIKSAREKKKLRQEELAKNINEHVSVIHALETQKRVPSEKLVHKLEKALGIRLYE